MQTVFSLATVRLSVLSMTGFGPKWKYSWRVLWILETSPVRSGVTRILTELLDWSTKR